MDSETNDNLILEAALEHLANGRVPIPLRIYFDENSKVVKQPYGSWRHLQSQIPSRDEVITAFNSHPGAQIALVTGAISKIVVIDIDKGASKDAIKNLGLPATLTVKTPSGGLHAYLVLPPGQHITSCTDLLGNNSHIDVRADGGIIVIPPSKFPDGESYEYSFGMDFDNTPLAEIPPHLMSLLVDSKTGSVTNSKNIEEILKGVEEGSRNSSALSLAGKLYRDLPVRSWGIVLPLIIAWNRQSNRDPLSDQEIETVCASCRKMELSRQENDRVEDIDASISLSELWNKDIPKVEWLLEKIFESGTINMLSAAPNQYKSWVVLLIAISVAKGVPLFGQFLTCKKSVLIINEEDTEGMLKNRCQMLMGNLEDIPVHFHIGKGIKLNDGFIQKIIQEIQSKDIGLVILDSLRSVHGSDENNSQEMQEIMDQLKKLKAAGVTVIFTHHHRKKLRVPGNNKDEFGEDSRGSSAINAAVHGHISCAPVEKDGEKYLIITQHKLKAAEKIKPFQLLISKSESGEGMEFIYEGEVQTDELALHKHRGEILDVLDKNKPKWLGIKDFIRVGIKGGSKALSIAVKSLVSSGLVEFSQRKSIEEKRLEVFSIGKSKTEGLFKIVDENGLIQPVFDS